MEHVEYLEGEQVVQELIKDDKLYIYDNIDDSTFRHVMSRMQSLGIEFYRKVRDGDQHKSSF